MEAVLMFCVIIVGGLLLFAITVFKIVNVLKKNDVQHTKTKTRNTFRP